MKDKIEGIFNLIDINDKTLKCCKALVEACDYDKTKLGFLNKAIEKDGPETLKKEFIRLCPTCVEIETISDDRLKEVSSYMSKILSLALGTL